MDSLQFVVSLFSLPKGFVWKLEHIFNKETDVKDFNVLKWA
jgi:hypothetical protein